MIDLPPADLELVRQILRNHVPDCAVWVFGSRVSGRAKKYSDLDLAVLSEEPLSLTELGELQEAFSESDLPIKVDVVDYNRASEEFQAVIRRQYVALQERA